MGQSVTRRERKGGREEGRKEGERKGGKESYCSPSPTQC